MVFYSCDPGLVPEGRMRAVCTENGWSSNPADLNCSSGIIMIIRMHSYLCCACLRPRLLYETAICPTSLNCFSFRKHLRSVFHQCCCYSCCLLCCFTHYWSTGWCCCALLCCEEEIQMSQVLLPDTGSRSSSQYQCMRTLLHRMELLIPLTLY